jgi:hypothetical protein
MRGDELWGFCEPCESWLLSPYWFKPQPSGNPACPVCGASPSLIEEREDGKGRITLLLRLPPGAVEPAL